MDTEGRERGCVSVFSRLNGNKKHAAEIDRAVKVENKVWLMFVQGKQPETMYARCI